MSMLSDAIANLLVPGLQAAMGLQATYTRGETVLPITVIAQDGGRDREYATRLGDSPDSTDYAIFTPELGYAGYSVQVSALATLSPPVPQRGDVISITCTGDAYRLVAPSGLNPWRWEDLPFKQLFRCHTKKV